MIPIMIICVISRLVIFLAVCGRLSGNQHAVREVPGYCDAHDFEYWQMSHWCEWPLIHMIVLSCSRDKCIHCRHVTHTVALHRTVTSVTVSGCDSMHAQSLELSYTINSLLRSQPFDLHTCANEL